LNREEKAAVIEDVASQIKEAQAIFAVDYRGLSVKQAADLRARLIEIDANLRVVKNTLTERAADQVGAEPLKQFLEGPTAFTFVSGDPVLAAKALAGFRRETQLPEFKGGWMDGKEVTVAEIEALSKLPSLDVMHGQLVGLVANPLSGLVRTLNALLSGIAIALGQIQEQGLVRRGAAEPARMPSPAAADAPPRAGRRRGPPPRTRPPRRQRGRGSRAAAIPSPPRMRPPMSRRHPPRRPSAPRTRLPHPRMRRIPTPLKRFPTSRCRR
jgi:large subunit ribosomal protein L10